MRQIASDYAHTGDLTQAQAALAQLGLANPGQMLVSLAEEGMSAGAAEAEIRPLARLAEAVGARSPKLVAFLAPTAAPTPTLPPPTPTPEPTFTAIPTPTESPATAVPTEAPTAAPQQPRVVAQSDINLRAGPGRAYPVVGQLKAGQEIDIVARNDSGDWWQLSWAGAQQAWVAGTVINVLGPIDTVAVAAAIPTPAPQPTAPPRPTAAPTEPPKPAGPDFQTTSIRLWGVEENGGLFDGASVHCGEKRQLRVMVVDAGGNPINGVTLKSALTGEEQVTGGKGPGLAEYILGGGQDIFVLRDADGREVTSTVARGMSTNPHGIDMDTLIGAGYCRDAADCEHFRSQWGCNGHYSWDVTFRRAY